MTAPVETQDAPRLRRADARANHDRIVTAARTVFAERGSEASMEEIARRAEVGVGTLYRHFPRRIDLVEAVYRGDVDALVSPESPAPPGEPWDDLVAWLHALVRYAEAKRTFLTELHEAFEKSPDLALQSRERIRGAADQVLRRAQDAGQARSGLDGGDLVQLVAGMCLSRGSTVEQNERLLQVVIAGLRPC